MKFDLIDSILELSDDRIVAIKNVSLAEEYLADHFPGFPVLPGVLMIEVMAQAARRLLRGRAGARLVLGEVKALRFNAMVRPGESLRVEVSLIGQGDDGSFALKGSGVVLRPDPCANPQPQAVSGRFTMRPVRR